jgi:hypothetical protein
MELVDLVRSYHSVLCFLYLPTDDPWIIDTSTPPRSRPLSAHMVTSLLPRPTWYYIAQHTLHSLRTPSACELSTQRLIGRDEGLGRYNIWRLVRGGTASE